MAALGACSQGGPLRKAMGYHDHVGERWVNRSTEAGKGHRLFVTNVVEAGVVLRL